MRALASRGGGLPVPAEPELTAGGEGLSAGTSPRATDPSDPPGRAPGAGSQVAAGRGEGGAANRSPRAALRLNEPLQLSTGCQRDGGRQQGQGTEEEEEDARPVCIPPPPCPFLLGKGERASTRKGEGQIPYLHLGGGLDELCDGDLVLLEPPLDELGAADVDGAEDVPGVVLHEGAAVDDQGALRSVPQEAGQLLRVHHLAWELVPSHNGPVPSMASGGHRAEGQGRDASTRLPEGNKRGGKG